MVYIHTYLVYLGDKSFGNEDSVKIILSIVYFSTGCSFGLGMNYQPSSCKDISKTIRNI